MIKKIFFNYRYVVSSQTFLKNNQGIFIDKKTGYVYPYPVFLSYEFINYIADLKIAATSSAFP